MSFSLVAIPARLVIAVDPGRVSLNMLHAKQYSSLERRMYCPQQEEIVERDDSIRGFEIEPGKHVLITKEELELEVEIQEAVLSNSTHE